MERKDNGASREVQLLLFSVSLCLCGENYLLAG
jgi:hypothetical protein